MASSFEAIVGAGFMAFSGFFMWRRGMKVGKLSAGTATSKIATAAKGFVELSGIARPIGDIPLTDPITSRPCVWFHVITEEKSWLGKESDWKVVSTATSNRPFVIEDSTGRCAVSCAEKEVERGPPEVIKIKSTLRHKVWRLHNGDSLYALGHLVRLGDGVRPEEKYERHSSSASELTTYDRKKKITESMMGLLKLWKQDQRNLIARFDTNGDGRVDSLEWEKAQAKARELAETKLDSASADSAPAQSLSQSLSKPPIELNKQITHQLVRPTDGRPLLIAKGTEKSLTTHNRWHSILGLLLFVGGVIGLVLVLRQR